MSLGTFLKLRLTHVLLIAFHRKASPSPSNAWLSKIRVDLVSVRGSVVVVLHRPALIMGPPNLFMILTSRVPRWGSETVFCLLYKGGSAHFYH
jgi:hypothetical protein